MKRTSKVKLSDIAQACGVGASTVSRVLNNVSEGFSVKPEIRDRILKTARNMNYIPDAMARNLRTRRTGNILIFGFRFSWTSLHSMYGYILEECTDMLVKKGYTVNAVFGSDTTMNAGPILADGAILLTAEDKKLMSRLDSAGIPFVVINDNVGDLCSWIDIDDEYGTRLAMKTLLKKGHTGIAYCGPIEESVHQSHKSITLRRDVYRKVMKEEGLKCIEFDESSDLMTMVENVKQNNVTALLVYCNNQAEFIQSFFSFYKPAGGEVEIITFNSLNRRMLTVNPDFKSIGQTTVKYLLNSINGGKIYNKTFKAAIC